MPEPIRFIVGLGNPGNQYSQTRHNAGFWFVDELARRYSGQFLTEKRFSGEVCRISVGSELVYLLKPTTFMNRSGIAARQLTDFYRIPVNQILVAHDELDLPAGDVRLKFAGGHGGHNGLRDLHAHLGADYWRLRLGIAHPGDRNKVVDYVLSSPTRDEEIAIKLAIDKAAEQIALILAGDLQKAMNELHRK